MLDEENLNLILGKSLIKYKIRGNYIRYVETLNQLLCTNPVEIYCVTTLIVENTDIPVCNVVT